MSDIKIEHLRAQNWLYIIDIYEKTHQSKFYVLQKLRPHFKISNKSCNLVNLNIFSMVLLNRTIPHNHCYIQSKVQFMLVILKKVPTFKRI